MESASEEILQLMVLPLSIKGKRNKQEGILRAVELAKRLPDQQQKIDILAGMDPLLWKKRLLYPVCSWA